jgi:branched-chain amino acid transport system ATP-binding protein
MALLELKNIEVKYAGVILVLKGVSLRVEKGSIVTLLGNNGAGKSTTLKAISGLLKAENGRVTNGSIEYEGNRIENGDPERIARQGITQVLEGRRTLQHLSVEDNLRVAGLITGSGSGLARDLDMVYNYFPILKHYRNRTSGYLSGGEQQMLVVGRALMAHPKLMMVDEASLGLAPLLVKEILGILRRINQDEGVSILLVEQNANAALSLADYGYVMENGTIAHHDTAERLKENSIIKKFYLGLAANGGRRGYRRSPDA